VRKEEQLLYSKLIEAVEGEDITGGLRITLVARGGEEIATDLSPGTFASRAPTP